MHRQSKTTSIDLIGTIEALADQQPDIQMYCGLW
jgi:hypothetical protein